MTLTVMKAPGKPPAPSGYIMVAANHTTTRSKVIGDTDRYMRLDSWHAVVCDTVGDTLREIESHPANTPSELWWRLLSECCDRGVTWIIASDMHTLMSTSGWYQQLDTGEWDCGADAGPRTNKSELDHNDRYRGYLVVSDPPTLVLCRHVATRIQLQLLDAANWGFPRPIGEGTARDRARALAEWWRQYRAVVKQHLGGQLRATAGATAWQGWRAKHLTHKVVTHDWQTVRDLERDAIYPGRSECYRLGRVSGPVYHYDVRSAYPYFATTRAYPAECVWSGETGVDTLRSYMRDGLGAIASVGLDASSCDYPYRDDTGVYYPRGSIWTVLCGDELARALGAGEVRVVNCAAVYRMEPILRSYADAMLLAVARARCAGRNALVATIKFLTNGLWGRFAQRTRNWMPCTCGTPAHAYDSWIQDAPPLGHVCGDGRGVSWLDKPPTVDTTNMLTRWRSIGWRCEYTQCPQDAPQTSPAVLAFLAGYCRARLATLINIVGRRNMIYCDTDGFYCTERGRDNLEEASAIGGDAPGDLRHVGTYPWVQVYGIKHIDKGDGTWTHAGMPATARRRGDNWYWREPLSLVASLGVHEVPNGRMLLTKKSVSVEYLHGRLTMTGHVEPILPLRNSDGSLMGNKESQRRL